MKVLFYDCFSGISGDMNLGAMIDIGIDKNYLVGELRKLNLPGWELLIEKDQRHGITGTKATVKMTRHEHAHRHLSDIMKIIGESALDEKVKELSGRIFSKIADAEAKVHGISVEEVHFHEVGAVDSIVDIVGAAICFNAIDIDKVFVSTVELGGGFVRCDHGKLPVPAPATAEILKGIPARRDNVNFEATTPTGAAILATLGTDFGMNPEIRITSTGYGVGQKDHPEIPNLLRVFIGEMDQHQAGHDAILMECNIDDMNPEFYEHINEKLFKAGAADVYISNIIMKKGRPGNVLSVICERGREGVLKEIIFTESTTVGIRSFPFKKDALTRKFEKLDTPYGRITVKRSFFNDIEVSCKPEYDECRRIAEENGIPLKTVYNNIMVSIVKTK